MGVSLRLLIGIGIISLLGLAAIFAPALAPHNPTQSSLNTLAGATAEHWLGTDELGRDILSRLIYGTRTSFMIGLGAAAFSVLGGVPAGLIAGYFRGRIDVISVQIIDLFIALPGLVLALIITAMIGPTLLNLVIVLGVVSWPEMARLVRGQVLNIRELPFIEAAEALGSSPWRVLAKHIWPNIMRVVFAQFAVSVSAAIFTSASLSFLGLGIAPPTPDWGSMVRTGFDFLAVSPLMSLTPGGAVAVLVVGFYLVGSSIE